MIVKNKLGNCPHCGGSALIDLTASDVSPYEHILEHPYREYKSCDGCGAVSVRNIINGYQYPLADSDNPVSGPVVVSYS